MDNYVVAIQCLHRRVHNRITINNMYTYKGKTYEDEDSTLINVINNHGMIEACFKDRFTEPMGYFQCKMFVAVNKSIDTKE